MRPHANKQHVISSCQTSIIFFSLCLRTAVEMIKLQRTRLAEGQKIERCWHDGNGAGDVARGTPHVIPQCLNRLVPGSAHDLNLWNAKVVHQRNAGPSYCMVGGSRNSSKFTDGWQQCSNGVDTHRALGKPAVHQERMRQRAIYSSAVDAPIPCSAF